MDCGGKRKRDTALASVESGVCWSAGLYPARWRSGVLQRGGLVANRRSIGRIASSSELLALRSAGFQPAVSPTSSRQTGGMPIPLAFSKSAGWKPVYSAARQGRKQRSADILVGSGSGARLGPTRMSALRSGEESLPLATISADTDRLEICAARRCQTALDAARELSQGARKPLVIRIFMSIMADCERKARIGLGFDGGVRLEPLAGAHAGKF